MFSCQNESNRMQGRSETTVILALKYKHKFNSFFFLNTEGKFFHQWPLDATKTFLHSIHHNEKKTHWWSDQNRCWTTWTTLLCCCIPISAFNLIPIWVKGQQVEVFLTVRGNSGYREEFTDWDSEVMLRISLCGFNSSNDKMLPPSWMLHTLCIHNYL